MSNSSSPSFMSTITSCSPTSIFASSAWMSWWDRYLAPNDLRRRQQEHPPSPFPSSTPDNGAPNLIAPTNNASQRIGPSHRRRRQNALFAGGLVFTTLSIALTQRTILRKRIAAYPSLFTPSHMHIQPPPGPTQNMTRVEGSLLAIEALGLATLNVVSVFMAGIGGAMCWFDVAEVEDLKGKVAAGTVADGVAGLVDDENEKEVEGWFKSAFDGGQGQEEQELGARPDGKGTGNSGGFLGEGIKRSVLAQLEENQREKLKSMEKQQVKRE